MAVLQAKYLHYDLENPKNPDNDRLGFSARAMPARCFIRCIRLRAPLRQGTDNSAKIREPAGRPPNAIYLTVVDVATGSLGQGLPIAVGMALNAKYLDKLTYHAWVVLGDSEIAEGSQWEAFEHASFYKLDNLTAILDMNRLGQRGPTMIRWNGDIYAQRARAFGWHVIQIDGHNLEQIDAAYVRPSQGKDSQL